MQPLFSPLPPSLHDALTRLPHALEAVQPLNAAHRRQLTPAIEELSLRLTSERGVAPLPYWSAPRLTAAYLWYFLPWNIIRLARLFGGLDLPAPTPLPVEPSGEALPRLLVDVGSGPLSLPLALWLAKPAWRTTPLTVLCLDAAPHPLELGRRLFTQLAGEDSPWRIVPRRAPVDALGREAARLRGVPWLVSGANVLNELKSRPSQPTYQRLENVLEQVSALLEGAKGAEARALFVEPGTRLGGKTITALRELTPELGLEPMAPCPHAGECPMQGGRSWCHFTFDAQDAPTWLAELSRAASLNKEGLSLSFTLLRLQQGTAQESEQGTARKAGEEPPVARIISAPFQVPGVPGLARYACTERGLALVGRAENLPSGALVAVVWPEYPRQDRKSGAWILEHRERPASLDCTPAPQAPTQSRTTPATPLTRQHATARKSSDLQTPARKDAPTRKPSKATTPARQNAPSPHPANATDRRNAPPRKGKATPAQRAPRPKKRAK